MTTLEAARQLGLPLRTVSYLCRVGWIPTTKHGNSYIISEEAVRNFKRPALGRPRKENSNERND